MKQDKVYVKIVPDIRRIKTDSRFPLKLRITYKGERKYYATGLDASPAQWEVINSPEVKGKFQKMRIDMAEIEKKAFEREFFKEALARHSFDSLTETFLKKSIYWQKTFF